MEFKEFITEFTERTLANLDHIKTRQRAGDEVYEVTQLWNSLLGLIVLPRERDMKNIPRTRLVELSAKGWPEITRSGPEPKTLRELVLNLRNAITHFNVEFKPDEDTREIRSVVVWTQETDADGRPISGSRRWQGQIGVEDLDLLARKFVALYLEQFGRHAA